MITNQIQQLFTKFMGRETTEAELELIHYIHSLLVGDGLINWQLISYTDNLLLDFWVKKGYIGIGEQSPVVFLKSRQFWLLMNEALYLMYVDKRSIEY